MSMAALPLPPLLSRRDRRDGGGAVATAVGFGKNHRGSGAVAFFFENIEKLHEFGRISVFTNETP